MIIDSDVKEEIYKQGRKRGTILGATVTLLVMSMAYIISQGIMYWK